MLSTVSHNQLRLAEESWVLIQCQRKYLHLREGVANFILSLDPLGVICGRKNVETARFFSENIFPGLGEYNIKVQVDCQTL